MTDYYLWLLFAISLAINVLQFVAPRTKTTKDDEALEVLKKADAILPKPPPKS